MDFSAIVESNSKVTIPCPDWLKKCKMVLGTPDMLAAVVDECIAAKRFGLDTEGTGKDTRVFRGRTQSQLAGFSVAPTPDSAYYFPLAHKQNAHLNIPFPLFEREFQRLSRAMLEKRTRALLFNAPFDQEILTYCGAEGLDPWDELGGWEDGHLLVCLEDSGRKQTGLKTVAEEDWGWEVIELETLFSPDERAMPDFQIDFSRLDPASAPVLWYTCQDALLHLRIFEDYYDRVVANPRGPKNRHKYKLRPQDTPKQLDKPRTSQALVYQIEKATALATRWMTRNQVGTDTDKAKQLIEVGQREWTETVKALYSEVGRVLDRDVTPEKYKYLFGHPFVDAEMKLVDILKSCEAKSPKDREAPVRKGDDEYPGVYDINSPQQLGKLLLELAIPDLRTTEASGQVGTSDDDIEEIAKKHGERFPSIKLVGRMREINKALSTWLLPLYKNAEGGSVAVSWKQMGTDTGRYATPKPKHPMPGWLAAAFQTLPVDKGDRPECMRRIREVIRGRNGRFIVSCIAEDTLIHTSRGLLPIQAVRAGDEVVTEEGFRKVSAACYMGTQETIRLRTARGFELDLTPDHLVRTVSSDGLDWKEAGQLRVGDWVVQAWDVGDRGAKTKLLHVPGSPYEKKIRLPKKLSEPLAEMLGRFIGDGSVSHDHGTPRNVGFSLGIDTDALLPLLNAQAMNLFGVNFRDYAGKGDCICTSSQLARWFLKNTGKIDGNTCSAPPCILEASTSLQAAFLRGLFDADGSVGSRLGDGVSIWITSGILASQVQMMLLGCGIPSRKVPEERDTNFGHCSGWVLTVTGINYLKRFCAAVGFVTPRKIAALEVLLSDGSRRDITEVFPLDLAKMAVPHQRHPATNRIRSNGRRLGRVSRLMLEQARRYPKDICAGTLDQILTRNWAFDQIVDVAPSKITRVYDLKVPGLRQFLAGGIIVHNCDFSGVELRIVTSLSGEPKWVDAFFECSSCKRKFDRGDDNSTPEAPPPRCPDCGSDRIGDLHTGTAIEVLGASPEDADWKEKRGSGKCVHPDTIIFDDKQDLPRRIGSLRYSPNADEFLESPALPRIRTPRGCANVLSTYNGGTKDLYHVVTTQGVLTCTGRHGFQTADGSVLSVEGGLQPGALLAEIDQPRARKGIWEQIRYQPSRGVPHVRIQTCQQLAYVAGLYLGDGTKAGKNSVGICHGHVGKSDRMGIPYEQWQQIMADACRVAGFDPDLKKGAVYLGSRHVMRFMAALSLVDDPDGDADGHRILRIPDWVWKAGEQGLFWFLGGLFDTDGTAGARDASLSVTTKDAVFAGQIAAALALLGFSPRPEAKWNKKYERYYYCVTLRGSEAWVFASYMKHPGKLARIKNRKKSGGKHPHKVKNIIPAGIGPCVDVSLDSDDHLYWSNGLSTHNTLNFALVYGGGGEAASAAIGCDKNEGWRLNRQFGQTYTVLKQFWDYQHQKVRKDLYVTSAFGRIIPLLTILSEFRTVVSEAERNSVNAPVQSTSADITKIGMMLIYREVKQRGWQDKVLLIGTVHDELVFEIDPSVLEEAVDVFVPLMCRNPLVQRLNWPIPLTSDVEIGWNWSVPWNLWAMRAGEVRFFGDKKVKKPEDAAALGASWDALPSFPQVLLPFFKKRDLGYEIKRAASAPKAGAAAAPPPWIALDVGSELTEEMVEQVARVIAACWGTGPTMLRLRSAGNWIPDWAAEEVMVDAGALRDAAEAAKIKWVTPN